MEDGCRKGGRNVHKACLEIIMIVGAAGDIEMTYFTLKVPVPLIDPLSVTTLSL